MPSKLVSNRQKSSKSVSAAFEVYGAKVASALVAKLMPLLENGEDMPDVERFLKLLCRLDARDTALLLAADALLATERGEDSQSRTQRDDALSALYSAIVDLAEEVEFIFGPAARERLHLSGTTTKDPVDLAEQAKRIAAALTASSTAADTSTKLPAPRRPHIPFNAAAHAQQLLTLSTSLENALGLNKLETRQTERALLDRNSADWTQNRTFTRTATIFEQCCELVGEDALAARIRHTIAKPGNTVEEGDDKPSE